MTKPFAQHFTESLSKSQRNALRILLCSVSNRTALRRALKLPAVALKAFSAPTQQTSKARAACTC